MCPEELPPPYEVLLEKACNADGLLTLLTDKVDTTLMGHGTYMTTPEKGSGRPGDPMILLGQNIHHATLGILGLGRIGASALTFIGDGLRLPAFKKFQN